MLFPNPQTQKAVLSFTSKIFLNLSGSLTFYKAKLHIIYLNLLPNSAFNDPFHHFLNLFQQFAPFYDPFCLQCFEAVGWVAGRASCL